VEFSKINTCHWDGEVHELRLSCKRCEGLDRYPTLVWGCRTHQVSGEHGNVSDFFDGGPEDALLEAHFHAEVLAHLSGCVVALDTWYVRPRLFTRAKISSFWRLVSSKPFAKTAKSSTKERSRIPVSKRRRRSHFF
jgi:hypothetical protein